MLNTFFQHIFKNPNYFILVSKNFSSLSFIRDQKIFLPFRYFTTINFLLPFLTTRRLIISKFLFNFFNNNLVQFKSSKIWFFELELIGLGYKITAKNNVIRLNLGFSHLIFTLLPTSVFFIKKKSKIMLFSSNKLELSMLIARLLQFKPLNPYKLKGIKRKDLVFKLKPGKRTK